MSFTAFQAGRYTGAVYSKWNLSHEEIATLAGVKEWLQEAPDIPSLGRHTLARHDLSIGGKHVPVAIKSFSTASSWKDRYFRRNGSKAKRSFDTAVRLADSGVGTPQPVAYLENWEGTRLRESYYLCVYQEEITSFRDELNRLYIEDPLCRRIMTLMETVALAIADMHDAGVCHRDLGNQNILLRRNGDDAWKDVQFIDLNRAHISDKLSIDQRARDISRIDLPSDFLRVFLCMYFRHRHPSVEFKKLENKFRRRFAMHTASRKYRHPIREARQRKKDAELPFVPRGKELWVWDDRSVQAVSTMLSRERHNYYPAANNFYIARGLFKAIHPVYRYYREYMSMAFRREVTLAGRIGMSVGTVPGQREQERPFISDLGKIPVLLRFYRHDTSGWNEQSLATAIQLRRNGHSVFAAFVQDRAAIRDPTLWNAFVEQWMPPLTGVADWIEVGHAVNRVKWGVWNVKEYRALLEPVIRAASSSGRFKISGPAVIDFEFHYLTGLLDMIREKGCFDALSHHLYVDRRGAPENRQGRFSTVEKCALAKAIARWSPAVKGDSLIVSEVNWPLLGTDVYSPVNSPYIIPDSHTNDPSVDEETYANYMVRYYALVLCSGMVDAVYWWRLVARGFGLVDDSNPEWRPRPAYRALKTFVDFLGDAIFSGKVDVKEGIHAFKFRDAKSRQWIMAWAHPRAVEFHPTFPFEEMYSRDGRAIAGKDAVVLDGSPVYFAGVL